MRINSWFENNLECITADYSLRKDKTIAVKNCGFNTENLRWQEADGVARFVTNETIGLLEVSFFGPFWSKYQILDLIDYEHVLVAGSNFQKLWILSRKPKIDENIKRRFYKKTEDL